MPGGPPGDGGEPGAPDEILLAFAEPAEQRRLTVLVRLILAIPHLIVLYVLSIASEVVALICWFAALFTGRLPGGLADFQVGYLRWLTRFSAYLFLLTDVYPPFELAEADYPVQLRAQPGPLNRLAVLFRIILVIPAAIVVAVLGYGLSFLVMFVTWLIVLISGRMPQSLHEALAATVRYHIRVTGYFLMLTARYPGGLFGDPATSAFVAAPAGGAFPAGPADPAAPGVRAGSLLRASLGTASSEAPASPGYGQPPSGLRPARRWPAPASPALPGTASPLATASPPRPFAGSAATSPGGWSCPRRPSGWSPCSWCWAWSLRSATWCSISVVAATSSNNSVTRAEATISVEGSFATLSSTLSGFDAKVTACQGKLSCVNKADAEMSRAFGTFAQEMRGKSMPGAASTAAADRVRSDASLASSDFARLAAVTSPAQYQQVVASTGLESLLGRFDHDYQSLGDTLGAR